MCVCVCVCKGNDELRWQYRSIAEAWLCLPRFDLHFACQLWQLCTCLVQYKAKMPHSMLQIDKRRVSFVIRSALIYNNFHSSQSQSTARAIKLDQVKTQQKFTMLQERERRGGSLKCGNSGSALAIKLYGQSVWHKRVIRHIWSGEEVSRLRDSANNYSKLVSIKKQLSCHQLKLVKQPPSETVSKNGPRP